MNASGGQFQVHRSSDFTEGNLNHGELKTDPKEHSYFTPRGQFVLQNVPQPFTVDICPETCFFNITIYF